MHEQCCHTTQWETENLRQKTNVSISYNGGVFCRPRNLRRAVTAVTFLSKYYELTLLICYKKSHT